MRKQVRGTTRPTRNLRRFFLSAAVLLLLAAVLIASTTAADLCDGTHGSGWTVLDSTYLTTYGYDLPSGNFYLTGNLDLSKALLVNGGNKTTICLNGYVLKQITDNTRVFELTGSGTILNITDTTNTPHKFSVDTNGLWTLDEDQGTKTLYGGVITGGSASYSSGGAIENLGGTLNLYDGNIVGNKAQAGGAIYLRSGGYTKAFYMYGGDIVGNRATYAGSDGGGGVLYKSGTFVMNGGNITNNTAASYGGGVDVSSNLVFTLNGGNITENTAKTNGGGIRLSGTSEINLSNNVIIKDNYNKTNAASNLLLVYTSSLIKIANPLTGGSGSIGVTTSNDPGTAGFAISDTSVASGDEKIIVADVNGYETFYNTTDGGKLWIRAVIPKDVTIKLGSGMTWNIIGQDETWDNIITLDPVIITALPGYYFDQAKYPTEKGLEYKVSTVSVENDTLTISGKPTEDVNTALTNADKRTYKVTLSPVTDGSITGVNDGDKKEYNSEVIFTAAPTTPGYILNTLTVTDNKGEVDYTDKGNNQYSFDMPASDVTITATFSLPTYTVSLTQPVNGTLTGVAAGAKYAENADVIFTAKPDTGYELEKISFDVAGLNAVSTNNPDNADEYKFTMPAEPVTVSATFKPASYTVTVTTPTNGAINDLTTGDKKEYKSEVTFKAVPAPGYILDEITFNVAGVTALPTGNTDEYKFTMPDSDVTITATFSLLTYEVSLTQPVNGTLTGVAIGAKYAANADVIITAKPETGYELEKITFDVTGLNAVSTNNPNNADEYKFTMPAEPVTVSATFKPASYTVTVTAPTNGAINDLATSDKKEYKSEVTFKAVPAPGYTLDEITFNVAGVTALPTGNTDEYKFTMPASDVTITATFKELPPATYTVKITLGNNMSVAAGQTLPDPEIPISSLTPITINADEGYFFNVSNYLTGDKNGLTIDISQPNLEAVTVAGTPTTNVELTLSVEAKSYNPTVSGATITPAKPKTGEEVTITVTPVDGYKIYEIYVNDTNGNLIKKFTATDVEPYTFIVPPTGVGSITVALIGENMTLIAGSLISDASGNFVATLKADEGYFFNETFYAGLSDMIYTVSSTGETLEVNGKPTNTLILVVEGKTWTVSVDNNNANGQITADKTTAVTGETVTITATPSPGYKLSGITYTKAGETTPVEVIGNSFTMPASDVTVTATFTATGGSGGGYSGGYSGGSSTWITNTPTPTPDDNSGTTNDPIIYKVTTEAGYVGKITIKEDKETLPPTGADSYYVAEVSLNPDLATGEIATIYFKIPLSVLEDKGLGAADVRLYYYGENGWTALPTVYTVAGIIVYYEATTTGVNLFAIVFEENGATPKGGNAPTDVPTATDAPKSPGFGILAALAGLGAVAVLRRP